MPFLPFDRVDTLRKAGITQDIAAIVAMLEIQTTELKEIRDALLGGGGGNDIAIELGKIKNELNEGNVISMEIRQRLNQIRNKLDEGNNISDSKLTNINDTLEDIENKMPGPP